MLKMQKNFIALEGLIRSMAAYIIGNFCAKGGLKYDETL